MNAEKKPQTNTTQHVYAFQVFSLGKGKYLVAMEGVTHNVHISARKVRISLPSSPGTEIRFQRKSASFYRSPKDYAATILETLKLDLKSTPSLVPGDYCSALQNLIEIEETIDRPFSTKLFQTLFKTILELSKNKSYFLVKQKEPLVVLSAIDYLKGMNGNNKLEDFLSINANETDKEILGRLLCGVYLFENKTERPESFKSFINER